MFDRFRSERRNRLLYRRFRAPWRGWRVLWKHSRQRLNLDKVQRLYHEVSDLVRTTGARLVVLDSLHDLFSGNENARSAARQFITGLRAMVLPTDGAVLLLSHPSLSGMNSGTGMAGSTAWHNAVRSRLYLAHPTPRKRPDLPQEPEDEGDPNERVFKTMKAIGAARSGIGVNLISTLIFAVIFRALDRLSAQSQRIVF